MTTIFEFQRKPIKLRERFRDLISSDGQDLAGELRQETRLVIDGKTIFELPGYLLGLCFYGLYLVENLADGSTAHLNLSEGSARLEFDRRGDTVTVREVEEARQATVSYAELTDTWRRFATEGRKYLLEQLPDLIRHPEIGPWFDHYDGPPAGKAAIH